VSTKPKRTFVTYTPRARHAGARPSRYADNPAFDAE
jgi:hypothetical protein